MRRTRALSQASTSGWKAQGAAPAHAAKNLVCRAGCDPLGWRWERGAPLRGERAPAHSLARAGLLQAPRSQHLWTPDSETTHRAGPSSLVSALGLQPAGHHQDTPPAGAWRTPGPSLCCFLLRVLRSGKGVCLPILTLFYLFIFIVETITDVPLFSPVDSPPPFSRPLPRPSPHYCLGYPYKFFGGSLPSPLSCPLRILSLWQASISLDPFGLSVYILFIRFHM